MLIKVYGSKSKRLKNLIRDAVEYAAKKLIPGRVLSSMEISVKMNGELNENVAEMEWIDDHVRPRIFEISIDKNQSETLSVVCAMHEMVHVRQYAMGDLVQSLRYQNKSKWNKNLWVDESSTDYYDLPWEIEAHGREKGLTLGWLSSTDLLTEEEKESWRAKFMLR